MDNLSLRYYKKPRNKFWILIRRISLSWLVKIGIGLAVVVLIISLILYPIYTSKPSKITLLPIDTSSEFTILKSYQPFYAEYDKVKYISNKIEDIWYVNLGRVGNNKSLKIGSYLDYIFYQHPIDSGDIIILGDNYINNSKITLDIQPQYTTQLFSYKINMGSDSNQYTIYDDSTIIHEPNSTNSDCTKTVENNENKFICKASFGELDKKIIDIKLRDSNNKFIEVERDRLISYINSGNLKCNVISEPTAVSTKILCGSDIDMRIKVQDQEITLIANQPSEILVKTALGKNMINIANLDNATQSQISLEIIVNNNQNLSIAPTKEQYSIEPQTKLGFDIFTSENIELDINSNAKLSEKGYKEYNAQGVATNFQSVSFQSKGIKLAVQDKSLIFQIDTQSKNNPTQTLVYPGIISVDFNIKSESGKKYSTKCKMIVKVNDSINEKSTCRTEEIK
jgi:hypothetical protein